jgi:hypothetical protein
MTDLDVQFAKSKPITLTLGRAAEWQPEEAPGATCKSSEQTQWRVLDRGNRFRREEKEGVRCAICKIKANYSDLESGGGVEAGGGAGRDVQIVKTNPTGEIEGLVQTGGG